MANPLLVNSQEARSSEDSYVLSAVKNIIVPEGSTEIVVEVGNKIVTIVTNNFEKTMDADKKSNHVVIAAKEG